MPDPSRPSRPPVSPGPAPLVGPGRAARRRDQVIGALVASGALGAAGGAALGAAAGRRWAWRGAALGGMGLATSDAVTGVLRPVGAMKPLGQRIAAGTAVAALLGRLAGLATTNPVTVGVTTGALYGAAGVRVGKVVQGVAVGAAAGAVGRTVGGALGRPATVAATTALVHRCLAAARWRGRERVRLLAEQVPPERVRYVVPYEARTGRVGADYVRDLAAVEGGTFRRDPPDIGIVESLDALAAPEFDPGRVHPLIREFYEHTSRFTLSIEPEWRAWVKPGYRLYKELVARPLGQANVPSDLDEAQRGMVSTIDTISSGDDPDVVAVRGWVRTFADTGEPIYVGIYTTYRHDGVGYVSVGFPVPQGSFTATLQPRHLGDDGLLLTSRSDLPEPGHYVSVVEGPERVLTVLRAGGFDEEIEVYVIDGRLRTDHRFFLAGLPFLVLRYTIERRPAGAGPGA